MKNNDIKYLEQSLFEIITSDIKNNFNTTEWLSFRINDLAKQLQIKPSALDENMSELCGNLLRRSIEINHDNGNWENISIFISIKYESNRDLLLEFNPYLEPYLQYLNRQ